MMYRVSVCLILPDLYEFQYRNDVLGTAICFTNNLFRV